MKRHEKPIPIHSATTLATLRRTIFFVSMPFFIPGLMLPVFGKEIGASVLEIGLFFSAFSLMTVILRPLVGWGLDHFGRRGFFLAGVGGYAMTMFSFAFIDQAQGIVLARVLQGISSSLLWISVSAITADLAGEQERGGAFGQVTQVSNQGAIAGTALGFVLLIARLSLHGNEVHLGSWMFPFLGDGAINLYALFRGLRGVPETTPATAEGDSDSIQCSQTRVLLLLVTLVTGASAAILSPILIIFLQDKLGIGIETLSWAFRHSALLWAFLPAQLGNLADHFGRKPLGICALVLLASLGNPVKTSSVRVHSLTICQYALNSSILSVTVILGKGA